MLILLILLCFCYLFVCVMLSCLFLAACSSYTEKGLTSWLSCVLCCLMILSLSRCFLVHIRIKDEIGTFNMFKSSSVFLLTIPRWCFFFVSFLIFMFHVCLYYTVLSVPSRGVITCWERADVLALFCVIFPFVSVTFPFVVSGKVWYLIKSSPGLHNRLHF